MMKRLVWVISLAAILVACSGSPSGTPLATGFTPSAPVPEISTPTETSTPVLPTATSEPPAALVNGAAILVAEYESELARYQAAVGRELTDDDEQFVLNDMISLLLFAQGAGESGFILTEAEVLERLDDLIAGVGGESEFQNWLGANLYTLEGFRNTLGRSMAAAWMRDQITAGVSEAAEQVQLSQILVNDRQEADEIVRRLQAGADFTSLAFEYDPVTNGYLGWVPRGYLLEPAVDEAAFALGVGQFSQVIESDIGYHVLYVMDRQMDHPLTPDARMALQEAALREWLAARWEAADIELLILDGGS